MVRGLFTYLGGMVGLLLPPRYRSYFPAAENADRRAALASAIAQCFIAGGLYIWRFTNFVGDVQVARLLIEQANKRGPDNPLILPTPAVGILAISEFFFKPLNMFLFYMFFEGLVRTTAAIVNDKVGSLPLYLVSWMHGLWSQAQYKRKLGPLVADHVVQGNETHGYDLKVYSCRPKLHWNPYMTVKFDGVFYQYFKEEYGEAPRRFIYYLRKQHVGIPAVVIDHYDVKNVLRPEPDKWAGTPGFWETAFPNQNLPPIVPDEVVRGTKKSDYDLKIYSCRRKEDWNTFVTIEFEEQWYRLVKDEKGTKSHPFVYYLRKAAETRPAVVIRKYDS